jgi:hypothetical protein
MSTIFAHDIYNQDSDQQKLLATKRSSMKESRQNMLSGAAGITSKAKNMEMERYHIDNK